MNLPELTDAQKLIDCQRENDALREAAAEAWAAHAKLEREIGRLKTIIDALNR